MARGGWSLVFVIAMGVLAASLVVVGGPGGSPDEYERATVAVLDANGTQLATVEVRIADTDEKRRVGLSETGSLPDGEGMLFVHDDHGPHGYWMKNMSFPIDIVFVADDGEITTVHHAAVPEKLDGYGHFPGRGVYVLEVPRGWTNETGVTVGDRVAVPDSIAE
jgi:uncharacterized membrane protein (UPF0127 family)